jgi:hypothetical protein
MYRWCTSACRWVLLIECVQHGVPWGMRCIYVWMWFTFQGPPSHVTVSSKDQPAQTKHWQTSTHKAKTGYQAHYRIRDTVCVVVLVGFAQGWFSAHYAIISISCISVLTQWALLVYVCITQHIQTLQQCVLSCIAASSIVCSTECSPYHITSIWCDLHFAMQYIWCMHPLLRTPYSCVAFHAALRNIVLKKSSYHPIS